MKNLIQVEENPTGELYKLLKKKYGKNREGYVRYYPSDSNTLSSTDEERNLAKRINKILEEEGYELGFSISDFFYLLIKL